MKRILSFILALVLCFGLFSPSKISLASVVTKEPIKNSDLTNTQMLAKIKTNTQIIEQYIKSQGTTVQKELNKEKDRLRLLLKIETNLENKEKLNDLIESYTKMILEYDEYLKQEALGNGGITIQGVYHPVLTPAVATIVSYFNMNQYYLSAELLTYANDRSNGGVYSPYFGYRILGTAKYAEVAYQIRTSGKTSGNGNTCFEKGSTVEDNDLYYAIHACNYQFTSYNRNLIFSDIYDYDVNADYQGIAGTAINTMYMAQVLGVIVPFSVKISVNY